MSPHVILSTCIAAMSLMAAGDPANTIWYRTAATDFDQSLPLGNGRLGAMVYGGVDNEQIILNEESVWSGSAVDDNLPGAGKHLAEIRRLLAAKRFKEANALTRKVFNVRYKPKHGKNIAPFGRYQNLGSLHLSFTAAGAVTEYRRELDLASAMATVTYVRGGVRYTREHFVSRPDDVFVTRLSGPISFTASMTRDERFETKAVNDHELLITGRLNDGFNHDGLRYAARLRIRTKGGSVTAVDNTLVVTHADEALLLVAAATDYRGFAGRRLTDPLAATTRDLDRAEKKSFGQLRAAQRADHAKLYSRSGLQLDTTANSQLPTDQRLAAYRKGADDPSLTALMANMGRYLLISSSRPGGLPANLQGIWAKEVHTMWNGDYHFNINLQMNYWPAQVWNLAQTQEPLNDLIASLATPGAKTAKAYYNAPGWIVHRKTNIWGYTAPGKLDMGAAAWLCEHLWEQYLFTGNKGFLTRVYPTMRGLAEFYLHYLWEEPEHRWLVTGPSNSPENAFAVGGGTFSICAGPTIDMQQLREFFGNTIEAAGILGVDQPLRQRLRKASARLAPNQIGPDGRLQEWLHPYKSREKEHRHCSPLYGLYPYYEITPEGTPKMAAAARKLLEDRGVGQSTGWSNAWKICLWARLGDAQKAHDFVHRVLVDNTYANLFSQMRPNQKKLLFQIDANFGFAAGVAEMLLQSHPKNIGKSRQPVLHILPALPKAWANGKVHGLRARGGYEVSIEWNDGKLVDCTIKSLFGNPVRVVYANRDLELKLNPGEARKVFFGNGG